MAETHDSWPADGTRVRITETETIGDPVLYPGLPPVVGEVTVTTATVRLPEHMRPPMCGGCDGPALPGGDFRHVNGCELAAVDWAQHEADLA